MKYFLLLWTSYSHFAPTNTGNFGMIDVMISGSEPNYRILGRQMSVREKRFAPFYHLSTNSYPNMLIYSKPLNDHMKEVITNEHNRLRRIIPATDMLQMYWSDELAISAQRHANRCDFRHSNDRINVGENIWVAPYSNYTEAVSRWFNEVYDLRCDCKHAYKHCCGHYVQIVWSETNLVGCGYAKCRDIWGVQNRGYRHIFVCHYNPQGNTVYITKDGFFAMPAFTWAGDKPRCSNCPSDASACSQGLCFAPSLSMEEADSDLDANKLGQN
uniref:SCP domain-containing protein n=2 Tax=Wuchereria bancrofti TaxID=6293 RepID=A0AAF5RUI8_WUCBA